MNVIEAVVGIVIAFGIAGVLGIAAYLSIEHEDRIGEWVVRIAKRIPLIGPLLEYQEARERLRELERALEFERKIWGREVLTQDERDELEMLRNDLGRNPDD